MDYYLIIISILDEVDDSKVGVVDRLGMDKDMGKGMDKSTDMVELVDMVVYSKMELLPQNLLKKVLMVRFFDLHYMTRHDLCHDNH